MYVLRQYVEEDKNKFDLQHIIGSVDSLLTTIEENWPTCLLHIYYNRQQCDCIKKLRSQSTYKTFIVARVNFPMNYTLVHHREVQQNFFSHRQVTLLTIHTIIGQEHRNSALISDRLEHNSPCLLCTENSRSVHKKEYSIGPKNQLH